MAEPQRNKQQQADHDRQRTGGQDFGEQEARTQGQGDKGHPQRNREDDKTRGQGQQRTDQNR